jgi:hypothetical protein
MTNQKHKFKQNKEWLGIFIIIIGVLFLANTFYIPIPNWLISWPMFIIGVGLLVGINNKFKDWTWLVISAFGFLFLVDKIAGYDVRMSSIIFPALLITLGIRMLRKSKSKRVHQFDEESGNFTELGKDESLDDRLELVAVFAGNKKIIVSKNIESWE